MNTTSQQILDRIELKLQEHLNKQFNYGKNGENNSSVDTANYLTGWLIGILKLEVVDKGDKKS